jgi:hypothetical protein
MAHTTSRCVGSNKTPLCVLDSYQVGWVRDDTQLSLLTAPKSMIQKFIDHEVNRWPLSETPANYYNQVALYRITGCRVLTAEDRLTGKLGKVPPGAKKDRDHAWYPGDVQLTVEEVKSDRTGEFRASEMQKAWITPYVFRRTAPGRWRLVDWAMGDTFPLQGHVGPPCRPEDGEWQTLSKVTPALEACYEDGTNTPPCGSEHSAAIDLELLQDEAHNPRLFLRYKVVDCQILDLRGPHPGHWDPHPMQFRQRVNDQQRSEDWADGSARVGLRMQLCNSANNSCYPEVEFLSVYYVAFKDRWEQDYRVDDAISGMLAPYPMP